MHIYIVFALAYEASVISNARSMTKPCPIPSTIRNEITTNVIWSESHSCDKFISLSGGQAARAVFVETSRPCVLRPVLPGLLQLGVRIVVPSNSVMATRLPKLWCRKLELVKTLKDQTEEQPLRTSPGCNLLDFQEQLSSDKQSRFRRLQPDYGVLKARHSAEV